MKNLITRKNLRKELFRHLNDDPAVAAGIAKMARSEVKNYLALLAEEAEMPFPGAAGFLRGIQLQLGRIASTNADGGTNDPDEPYDASLDSPFNVIDKITLRVVEPEHGPDWYGKRDQLGRFTKRKSMDHAEPVHDENIAICQDECCPGFGGPAYPWVGSGCRPHGHPEHIHTAGSQD